jgi:hypothetical protein
MKPKMKAKITVRTFNGAILTYHTEEYELRDGVVRFKDERDAKIRSFPVADCQIEEAVR